ncbi:MAG TPA: RidA family protein [Caulobacteraceae bacterium]|jgi:enamine deaminase RidA (YjgF/YER057c/UK114 family)
MAAVEHLTRAAMKPLLEPYGLCEAVRKGGSLYISGQTGIGEDHQVAAGGLKAQAVQAFRNLKSVVELAGGTATDLVSLTWYLVEGPEGRSFMEDAVDVMAAKEEVMPGVRSAMTAVRVAALLTTDLRIEIQGVAKL